jgi:hypothetical protein
MTFGLNLKMTQVKLGNEIARIVAGWFKSTATVVVWKRLRSGI